MGCRSPDEVAENARIARGVTADPAGALFLFRNDVGTRNRSLRVQLEGRVSNRSAVGSTIQIRAGSLGARTETSSTTPRMRIERYLRIDRRDQRELALAHIGRAVEVHVARRKHSSRRRPRCTGGRVPLRRASGHIVPPRAAVAESAWSVGGPRQQIERPVVVVAEALVDALDTRFMEIWQLEAGMKTYRQAVADVIAYRTSDGERFDMTVERWLAFSHRASLYEACRKAREMGIEIVWDCELPKTVEGFYQIQGGIEYAIAKSLAAAPFADLLWMETKTANLEDARTFAEAIHAEYPDQMLAYNLSPSFNWDTTGMSDDEMRRFPEALGALGYVFNFITYGGHQIDGLAEEFATALKQNGMLALAQLQRSFRLVESPYRTPQTLVGGPRLDGALMASSGRTAATKAMGKASTQHQHLVQTEVPPKLLESWLEIWRDQYEHPRKLRVQLRPHAAGSELLELKVLDDDSTIASIIFATIQDRRGQKILTVRDQNTVPSVRNKRLMTLLHLFLLHRYKTTSVYYLSPTEDNTSQAQRMKALRLFSDINIEIGHIIVAHVNRQRVNDLLNPDGVALAGLICKAESGSLAPT